MNFIKISIMLGMMLLTARAVASSDTNTQSATDKLENVLIVMRHGVRPPTKSASAMSSLSDRAWPSDTDWGAVPGELTPHGASAIRMLGEDLKKEYAQLGLFSSGTALSEQIMIWGDGADQRTRASVQFMGQGLAGKSGTPIVAQWKQEGADPLFAGLEADQCRLDPEQASSAVLAQGPLETPELRRDLIRMQNILAPEACRPDAGTSHGICLDGPTQISASSSGVKLSGPLATASTVAESLLLEYENNLPMSQVGFGRASKADVEDMMRLHSYTSDLTRRVPYIALRRANTLSRYILNGLDRTSSTNFEPQINRNQKLVILVGHDTNLSNLAGAFGLDWNLPDQPDPTAPGTAIAFERWHDGKTGQPFIKVRIWYQGLEQVRLLSNSLADSSLKQVSIRPSICEAKNENCELDQFVKAMLQRLPEDCSR